MFFTAIMPVVLPSPVQQISWLQTAASGLGPPLRGESRAAPKSRQLLKILASRGQRF
jgi:hypothetical protein